jgi:hypothetical protein
MKELFKTTFKNGLTAVVSFDAENLDYSYVVTYGILAIEDRITTTFETNSPTTAFAMLAEIQRVEIEVN